MPFSQQSYMGGSGEPRQIFDRSGEILGQGLNRGFEILAQAVGKKAEKDEMRKRRKEYVDGMSKALNAIGVELPDEFQDMAADAQASYLETYTAQVLPEIKAEKERERLKQAWAGIAAAEGVPEGTPPDFIDDWITFQKQQEYANKRHEFDLEKLRTQTTEQIKQNKDYWDQQRDFAKFKAGLEGEGSLSFEDQIEKERYQSLLRQKEMPVDDLVAGLPDIPEVRALGERRRGEFGARESVLEDFKKLFGGMDLEELQEIEREHLEKLEDEQDTKGPKKPKTPSKPTIRVGPSLSPERPRGFAHDPSF